MSTLKRRESRISVVQVFLRNWTSILLWGGLTFVVTAPLVYWLTKPSYTATVELRVDPTSNSLLPGMDTASISQFYSEYVSTQKYKILKRSNMEKAINRLDPAVRAFITSGRPVDDLMINILSKRVIVFPSPDSLILTIEYSANRPEGIAEFLNALTDVYMEDLQSQVSSVETTRLQISDDQRKQIQTQIDALNTELHQLSADTGTVNFSSEEIPFTIELKTQEQAAINAENDRVIKEKRYNQFLSTYDKVKGLGTDSTVEDQLRADTLYAEQRRALLAKLDAANTRLEALTPESQARKDLQDSVTTLQQQLADLEASTRAKYQKIVQAQNVSTLEKQRLDLYNDYMVAKSYEDAIKKSYQDVQSKYSDVTKKIFRARTIEDDLTNLRAQLNRESASSAEIKSAESFQGHVSVENLAKTPTAPSQSNRVKNVVIDFVASFLWVVALFFVLEFLDTRIKSVSELKTFTGIQPSWPISHYSGNFLKLSLADPTSPAGKAVASLATRINHSLRNNQTRVVTFSGVSILSGTTEILLNCAHSMRTNYEKILVIDFNVRRPGVAYKLGIPSSLRPPISAVEAGPWERLTYLDQTRGVEVLAIQAARNLDNKILDKVLEQARERYDIVFVDSSPIIGSPQTEHIFMSSDLVVLTVHANFSRYPELHQTLDLTSKMGVKSVGLVLNWWKPEKEETEEVLELES